MLKKFLPHKDSDLGKKVLFWITTIVVGLFALGVIVAAATIAILSIGLPDVTELGKITPAQSTEIFDSKGGLMYTIHGDENRAKVPYEDISPYLMDSTVAIEDNSFWTHRGFDMGALAKVALHEMFGIGVARGGSTITQQYVKNTFLSSERSYIRKAKELILALRLERAYTKKEIMELYLNRIPYGNNAYGAQKASEIYFGKDVKDIDLAQAAVLASLPQAPSKYNPYGGNKFSHLLKQFTGDELQYRNIQSERDLTDSEFVRGLIGRNVDLGNGKIIYITGRTDLVLKAMVDSGKITANLHQAALNELQTMTFNQFKEAIKAPHFVFYIKQILEDKYGKDMVEQGGLKVYTTLDPDLQDYAEKAVEEKATANEKNIGANNMALLTVNNKTGQILAMVGSRDYFNEDIDGNVNVVLRPRQPGSSFKPIVYAQAFLNGYGPGSVTYDIPMKVGSNEPQDYDGKWLGQMTLRQALGKSRNIPAVQAYFLAGQQDPIIDLAQKMGVKSLDKSHSYGYPLAIGAGEVPLIEMVNAYATLANGGKRPEFTGILKVENSNGDVLEEWQQKEFEEVLDPQIAYLINDILSDRAASIGGLLFVNGKINAAKTGTSTKENKKEANAPVRPGDGLTFEFTPTITTGAWMGNTDGTGMGFSAEAYTGVGTVVTSVMTKALENLPDEPFVVPPGIKTVSISKASGKLPGPTTPKDMIISEKFASFAVPTEVDAGFYTVKIDKVSGLLATEFTPPDAVEEVTFQNYQPIADMFNWKQEIINYYKDKTPEELGIPPGSTVRIGLPPTEYDNIHTAESSKNAPTISISDPVGGDVLSYGKFMTKVDLSAKNGVGSVEFYIDDKRSYFTSTAPYTGHLEISKFMEAGSRHLIVAKVIDKLGYSAQAAIEVKVEAGDASAVTENSSAGDFVNAQ